MRVEGNPKLQRLWRPLENESQTTGKTRSRLIKSAIYDTRETLKNVPREKTSSKATEGPKTVSDTSTAGVVVGIETSQSTGKIVTLTENVSKDFPGEAMQVSAEDRRDREKAKN